ncbi:MAG: hypothetical protein ABL897_08850 [Hyphomicrobium sp.]
MDISRLMGALQTEGWDAFDESKLRKAEEKEASQEREQIRAEANIVAAALGTPAGEAFVEWLMRKTLVRPPGPAELSAATAEMYAIAKARREGQDQLVYMILSALATARGDELVAGTELSAPVKTKTRRAATPRDKT